MMPVRCWTCGAMVADKLRAFQETGSLEGTKRYCCRRMLIGHVDVVDASLRYTREVPDPPPTADSQR